MTALKRFSARHAPGVLNQDTLRGALAAAHAFATERGLDPGLAARLAIVVEELVENVLSHGATGAEVALLLELDSIGDAVAVALEDNGIPFDPRLGDEPLAPRPDDGGGVGLALVRAWSDIRSYETRDGVNRLELRLSPPSPL